MSVLALLLVASLASADGEGSPIRRVSWSWDGAAHELVLRRADDGELALVDRPELLLRSVVGPIVSTLKRRHWLADNGGYVDLAIVTERLGAYHFDLLAWVDASRQSGTLAARLLAGEHCGLDSDCRPAQPWPASPRCPSAAAVAAWDGAFADLAGALVKSGCFTADALALEPEAFWIDDARGDVVRLAVQRDHCDAQRSACTGALVYVDLVAPAAWRDWLADAQAGRGHLPRSRPLPP